MKVLVVTIMVDITSNVQFQHRFITMVVMLNYEQLMKVFDDGNDHSIHK